MDVKTPPRGVVLIAAHWNGVKFCHTHAAALAQNATHPASSALSPLPDPVLNT